MLRTECSAVFQNVIFPFLCRKHERIFLQYSLCEPGQVPEVKLIKVWGPPSFMTGISKVFDSQTCPH